MRALILLLGITMMASMGAWFLLATRSSNPAVNGEARAGRTRSLERIGMLSNICGLALAAPGAFDVRIYPQEWGLIGMGVGVTMGFSLMTIALWLRRRTTD